MVYCNMLLAPLTIVNEAHKTTKIKRCPKCASLSVTFYFFKSVNWFPASLLFLISGWTSFSCLLALVINIFTEKQWKPVKTPHICAIYNTANQVSFVQHATHCWFYCLIQCIFRDFCSICTCQLQLSCACGQKSPYLYI